MEVNCFFQHNTKIAKRKEPLFAENFFHAKRVNIGSLSICLLCLFPADGHEKGSGEGHGMAVSCQPVETFSTWRWPSSQLMGETDNGVLQGSASSSQISKWCPSGLSLPILFMWMLTKLISYNKFITSWHFTYDNKEWFAFNYNPFFHNCQHVR